MSEAEQLVTSIWDLVSSWLTPTILFCFINLTIVTIFFFSNFKTQNPTQLARGPSLLNRVRSINFSLYNSQYPNPDSLPTETSHYSEQPDPLPMETHETEDPRDESGDPDHVTMGETGTCEEVPKKMKKWASEKKVATPVLEEEEVRRRGPLTGRERQGRWRETASFGEDVDVGVDAQADDFISRFKKQLKLQRLDSLLRYKEMLGRGT